MSILKITDPDELRRHIAESSRWSPAADALDAECRDAHALAPHNRHMRSHSILRHVIQRTMGSLGEAVAEGVAPVVQAISGGQTFTTERSRDGSSPLAPGGAVRYCPQCSDAQSQTVPFWVAFGQYVVQLDLCGPCADAHILEHGAVPQVA